MVHTCMRQVSQIWHLAAAPPAATLSWLCAHAVQSLNWSRSHAVKSDAAGGIGYPWLAAPSEPALQSVPRVCILSNVWSHELSSDSAVGRFAGSRSRHRSTVRRSPRSFLSLSAVSALGPSHGSSVRPAIASCTAWSASAPTEWRGKARSPVRSSKAMTPMDQMSTADSTSMTFSPASSAWTTSGGAYFSEKLSDAVLPTRLCD